MYIYIRFLVCHEYIKEPSVSFIAKYFNNRTSATKTKNGNEVFLFITFSFVSVLETRQETGTNRLFNLKSIFLTLNMDLPLTTSKQKGVQRQGKST